MHTVTAENDAHTYAAQASKRTAVDRIVSHRTEQRAFDDGPKVYWFVNTEFEQIDKRNTVVARYSNGERKV